MSVGSGLAATKAIVAVRAEAGTLPDATIRDGNLSIIPVKDVSYSPTLGYASG